MNLNKYNRGMLMPMDHIVPFNTRKEVLVRVALLLFVFVIHLQIEPYKQEISETELMNDYKRQRKDPLVPIWALVILVIFLPLLILWLSSFSTRNYPELSQPLLAWSLALTINAIITISGKLIVGRPRPDYFYRCYPGGKRPKNLRCTGSVRDMLEGRKSFPSGHSSFSFCSLGFISIWLCGQLKVLSTNRGEGLRVLACLVPLVIAGVVAISRYCDNHHHWEDVFVGSVLGFCSSYFCYRQYFHALESTQAGCPYVIFKPFYTEMNVASPEDFSCTTNNIRATSCDKTKCN